MHITIYGLSPIRAIFDTASASIDSAVLVHDCVLFTHQACNRVTTAFILQSVDSSSLPAPLDAP